MPARWLLTLSLAALFVIQGCSKTPPSPVDPLAPAMVEVAYGCWPTGVWSWGSHAAERGAVFVGTDTNHVMKVRHSENPVANMGTPVDVFRNSPREPASSCVAISSPTIRR